MSNCIFINSDKNIDLNLLAKGIKEFGLISENIEYNKFKEEMGLAVDLPGSLQRIELELISENIEYNEFKLEMGLADDLPGCLITIESELIFILNENGISIEDSLKNLTKHTPLNDIDSIKDSSEKTEILYSRLKAVKKTLALSSITEDFTYFSRLNTISTIANHLTDCYNYTKRTGGNRELQNFIKDNCFEYMLFAAANSINLLKDINNNSYNYKTMIENKAEKIFNNTRINLIFMFLVYKNLEQRTKYRLNRYNEVNLYWIAFRKDLVLYNKLFERLKKPKFDFDYSDAYSLDKYNIED